MITIIGSGMGPYSIKGLSEKNDFSQFDAIYLDPNYKTVKENQNFFKESNNWYFDKYSVIKNNIISDLKKSKNIAYIVTGSPGFYSGATLILSAIEKEIPDFDRFKDLIWLDNLSCKDYIVQKMRIPIQDVEVLSLHGRNQLDLTSIFRKKYSIILADDETIKKLCEALFYLDSNDYKLTLFSKMNYTDEKIEQIDDLNLFSKNFNAKTYSPYTLLLEKCYIDNQNYTRENDFLHQRGMITKDYKRYLSVSELELQSNQVLWDVGAASGSIGISAYKLFKVKTYFFELKKDRMADLKNNLKSHKVIDANVLEGNVLETSKSIAEAPDRIFIGGGGKEIVKELNYFYDRLNENGIIVINFVALDYLSEAIEILKNHKIPFEVKAISLSTYKDISILLPEGERLMYQFKIRKVNNE